VAVVREQFAAPDSNAREPGPLTPTRIDLHDLRPIPEGWRDGSIAVGNFDGVHLGHLDLIQRLKRQAGTKRPALAVTFEPHPAAVLRPSFAPEPLMWLERKVELLLEAGATGVAVFRTGPWLLGLSAREFFDRVVLGQFGASGMVEGPTFGFGRDRQGNVERLADWCSASGLSFEVADPVEVGGVLISSSGIRHALNSGDLNSANLQLDRFHRVRGVVVHGAGRGAGLGIATANLETIQGLIPCDGVYAARARIGAEATFYPAATHIGMNSTFGEAKRTIEPHLLDFNRDLYGESIDLDLIAYLRPSRQFASTEELLAQIAIDIEETRRAFHEHKADSRA
jgi:riboflavin kinase / FMN adenylyltransferase